MCCAFVETSPPRFDTWIKFSIQKKCRNIFLPPSAGSKKSGTLFTPVPRELWWIPNLKSRNQIYLELISGKGGGVFSLEPSHTDYWPHFVFSQRTYGRSQNNLLLSSSSGFAERDRKSLPVGESSVIYRKWLKVLYPGPVVSCPQSPNHPHNLHFCRQRVLNHQKEPFTLSQWRWMWKLGDQGDCGERPWEGTQEGLAGDAPYPAHPSGSFIFSGGEC